PHLFPYTTLFRSRVEAAHAGGGGQNTPTRTVLYTFGESGRHDTRAVRGHHGPVRQQFTGVLEKDHSVAEQTPSLFRVACDDSCGLAVDLLEGRTGVLVSAHVNASRWS